MKQFSIPAGMRDLILGECEVKKQLQNEIESCLNAWGYKEVITPSIEFYKTYEVGFDALDERDAYKFIDNNGRIVMLRADMTVPIARVVATKFKDAKTPLRFRYCANVFKSHEELSGLQDEITDCGVELIGMDEKCGELEILVTALETLKVIKDKDFVLEIGNINFYREACKSLNLSKDVTLKLAKLISDKSLKELDDYLTELNVNDKVKEFFNQLPWLSGDVSILEEAKQYAYTSELKNIINDLEELNTNLNTLGYTNIAFDLGKVSNLDYYTGLIFEAFVEGVGARIMSGGSYNNLIGKYGRDLPAIGFSIKLDALLDVVENTYVEDKIYVYYPKNKRVEAILKSKELRNNKVVELINDDSYEDVVVKEEQ